MTDKLLTTKQFANLCRVEKRTLFYYDEINLLKPVFVSPDNKYRYYSPEQFDTMSMIKALQSVDMSLNEIKALMNEQDTARCKEILKEQITRIREKQAQLKLTEQFLGHTVSELERFDEIGHDVFFLDKLQDTYLYTEAVAGQEKNVFINYLTSGYHHGVIIDDYVTAVPKYTFKKVQGRKAANTIRPAGTYACIYKSASNGGVIAIIHGFVERLLEKRLQAAGPLYMEDIASDFISFPNQEFLFKLSVMLQDTPMIQ